MCGVAIAVSPPISLVSSAAATTQLTDTGAALVAGAGDISAPALLRHKTSLITGTVIVLCGDSIEVPTCGRAKISDRVTVSSYSRARDEKFSEDVDISVLFFIHVNNLFTDLLSVQYVSN